MGFHLPAPLSRTAFRGVLAMVCLGVGLAVSMTHRACQASCGDYVILRGSHDRTHSRMALELPAPQRIPCNSPACRGEVPQPPMPQAPPNLSLAEKPLALFAAVLNLGTGGQSRDWPQQGEHSRPGFRSLLERPPIL